MFPRADSVLHVAYNKITLVPVVDNAAALGAGNSQDGHHPDDTVVHAAVTRMVKRSIKRP